MLIVVAPSSSAIWITSAVKSRSARVASIGENSTSSTYCLACATAARAWPLTSSRVVCSWWTMWMSEVEMNVWIRGRSASLTAPQAASMSATCVRARPAITGPSTVRAIPCTPSKSPGEAIGNPASITSTPRRASCWAISSFSDALSEMPGDCSPSRSVVSKISTRLGSSGVVMSLLGLESRCFFSVLVRGYVRPPARYSPRRGRRRRTRSRRNAIAGQSSNPTRPRLVRGLDRPVLSIAHLDRAGPARPEPPQRRR